MSNEATSKKNEEMVEVRLPRNNSVRGEQQEFYSLNGKNYIIKRGVPVMVPKAVAALIESNQRAEDEAAEYQDNLAKKASPDEKG